MEIEFAMSKAGHDKGRIYLIKERDGCFAYLADGETRPLASPKKKNLLHIQVIRRLPPEVMECLPGALTDTAVKRALRIYQKFRNQNQED